MGDPPAGETGGGPLQPGRADAWTASQRPSAAVLLTMVLVIATAGLVYELVMAAVASYVLGDSVRQFSLVIGVYLSALGLGAYLSRFVGKRLTATFIDVELAAALVGGLSAPALFLAFGFTAAFQWFLFGFVIVVGVLVGIELPLLMRILKRELAFEDLVARALTFDYAGALVGSLAFSLVLVPHLGLTRTSVLCGALNALVGLASTWLLPVDEGDEPEAFSGARLRAVVVLLLLGVAFFQVERATQLTETVIYPGKIEVAQTSSYQRIVVTRVGDATELYLDGNLQFSSADEHRYHEGLVHPAMSAADRRGRVLVGGGGDGLAVREILRWEGVEHVTVVDLDPAVTDLARRYAPLAKLNGGSLDDARVRIVNADAMRWMSETDETWDVIVLDFPDPTTYSLGKLYSATFYRTVEQRLARGGAFVAQASSPFFGRSAFWCVVSTIESLGLAVRPYRVFVSSFGDWGFVMAKREPFPVPTRMVDAWAPLPNGLRFLDARVLPTLFTFPNDTARVATEVNRLDNQAVVGYYLDEWPRGS